MLPHLAKIVDEICLVKSVTDRPVQSRAGADLLQHRLLAAGPAVPRLVGALWARRGDAGSAGLRRDEHRQRPERRRGALVERLSADDSTPACVSAPRAIRFSMSPARRASMRGCSATRSIWSARSIGSGSRRMAIRRSPRGSRTTRWPSGFRPSAPELMDLKSESPETLDLYGCDPDKPSFARACLLARRMIERGVRFVNIYHEGWDAHSDVVGQLDRTTARRPIRPAPRWCMDLKQRGLLDDTLVIWGGEFGRTPMVETNPALGRELGRDHHPQAYTMWMAGGGVKAGLDLRRHRRTRLSRRRESGPRARPAGDHPAPARASITRRLTFHHAGRDFRLTDVHGKVVKALLA